MVFRSLGESKRGLCPSLSPAQFVPVVGERTLTSERQCVGSCEPNQVALFARPCKARPQGSGESFCRVEGQAPLGAAPPCSAVAVTYLCRVIWVI